MINLNWIFKSQVINDFCFGDQLYISISKLQSHFDDGFVKQQIQQLLLTTFPVTLSLSLININSLKKNKREEKVEEME